MTESNSHKKQMKTFTEKSNQKRFSVYVRERERKGEKKSHTEIKMKENMMELLHRDPLFVWFMSRSRVKSNR